MPGGLHQSPETLMALMQKDIDALREHQEEQDKLIEGMKTDRDKALLWGITALGAMVIGMGTWIANLAKDHWK